MARIKAFVEVPHESRTDWATFKQVAELLGLRLNQVTGWARSGHIVSCKVKGRRYISISNCQQYKTRAKLQAKHTKRPSRPDDTKAQEPEPQPEPIRCEVVPIQVGTAELAGIRLDGQEVIAAQLLEKILQLQPRSISTRLGRSDRFVEGRDYVVLRGRAMRAVMEEAIDLESIASSGNVTNLTVLTETGVSQVLLTMRSPVTDVLAGVLYGSNFMRRAARAVMQGDEEGFARNAADDKTDALAQCRAQLAQQQAKIDSMGRDLLELGSRVSVTEQDSARHGLTLDRVSTILEHLVTGAHRPEKPKANHADFMCTMTATEVVKHLSRMVKDPLSEKKVHKMARKIEVREHGEHYYGTGLHGHSERCRINGSYYIWHYSPAMIGLMRNFITGGQRDMWGE